VNVYVCKENTLYFAVSTSVMYVRTVSSLKEDMSTMHTAKGPITTQPHSVPDVEIEIQV